jgi:GT2 family glycosyltransferase
MPTDYPLVSCITTTYNKFEYLYETLDSIFIQDYPNIEFILGDDGSENFPEQVIRDYIEAHKSPNIRKVTILHDDENHGTVWNCSNCRDHANGTYIMGIASDDRFYDSHVVSDVVRHFQKTGAEIIVCKRQFVRADTDEPLGTMPFPNQLRWIKTLDSEKLFQKMASFGFISGANTYYSRALYLRMGGYDKRYKYIEDYPFFLKLLRSGIHFDMYERVSIKYRYGAGLSTAPHKKSAFNEGMYEDRMRYLQRDIIPYMDNFPYFRKQQMWVRLRRFEMEREDPSASTLAKYFKLFFSSPVGTIVQAWYQGSYKIRSRGIGSGGGISEPLTLSGDVFERHLEIGDLLVAASYRGTFECGRRAKSELAEYVRHE